MNNLPVVHRAEGSNLFLPVRIDTPAPKTVVIPTLIAEPVFPKSAEPVINRVLPFIEANTKEVDMDHLRRECIVPVFSKDNEMTISHTEFIETVYNAALEVFPREVIDTPAIRVSHIIKGRTPDAIHKPVSELLDHEKTIYYERMMFCFEIPSIHEDINGNRLNLTIGGVRAYNHDNLYSRKNPEKFSIFIGFKNLVCCNMCVSTDGYKSEFKALSVHDIYCMVHRLFSEYNAEKHLMEMSLLQKTYMTERQFAQFIGKARLYQYLPAKEKKMIPEMLITDTQIGMVAKTYYSDENFSIGNDSEIDMWRVYNLLTGANKSSYIDNFLDRAVNASTLAMGISQALGYEDNEYSWFIK